MKNDYLHYFGFINDSYYFSLMYLSIKIEYTSRSFDLFPSAKMNCMLNNLSGLLFVIVTFTKY